MNCRHCSAKLGNSFVDLAFSPPSNAYLSVEQLSHPEQYFPLKVAVCRECWLAQTIDFRGRDDLFTEDYAYFSSSSVSWLAHAERYTESIVERLSLDESNFVIELASNDGYLLKNFLQRGIPCLGIEPTRAAALEAGKIGIDTLVEFFGSGLASRLAKDGKQADLIIGNNVFAHVPDINDFVAGMKIVLKPSGVITLEFPSLVNLIKYKQFDTIYHEHFSYISLTAASNIMKSNDLRIFDVEELDTHGGSIRIYASHQEAFTSTSKSLDDYLDYEESFGISKSQTYKAFQAEINKLKNEALAFLCSAATEGKKVVAYGAAAKGNTFLNYAGIKADLISMVADVAPLKVGKYMPGSHIPIVSLGDLLEHAPDYVIILPWNLKDEISGVLHPLRERGAKLVTFIPSLEVF